MSKLSVALASHSISSEKSHQIHQWTWQILAAVLSLISADQLPAQLGLYGPGSPQQLLVDQGTIDHAREKKIVYCSVPAQTRCRRYAGVWRKEAHPVP
jgi:hypothetical protein